MIMDKTDSPPLLSGGLHPMSLEEFRAIAVDPFPSSERRPMLYANLEAYLRQVAETGLTGSIWLDGSYLTHKQEPDDIDLVIVFDGTSANALPDQAQQQLLILLDQNTQHGRYKLHVFAIEKDDNEGKNYWLGFFGTLRDGVTPKGMAELRINL